MRSKRKVAIAIAMGLVLGGLAATAAAGVLTSLYTTPVSYDMIFGGGEYGLGIPPGQCELFGVGAATPPMLCSALNTPYESTETPITASSGVITYFAVTTTNAATAGHQIEFSVRLCENAANSCKVPLYGITTARCSPAPGSKTCSWVAASGHGIPFQQWQPSGLKNMDPGFHDEGLIDIAARCKSKATASCAEDTYNPGHVSWSVAYIK